MHDDGDQRFEMCRPFLLILTASLGNSWGLFSFELCLLLVLLLTKVIHEMEKGEVPKASTVLMNLLLLEDDPFMNRVTGLADVCLSSLERDSLWRITAAKIDLF